MKKLKKNSKLKKTVTKQKTRKELRKDKRHQKKQQRQHFYIRRKELKIEYKLKTKEKTFKKFIKNKQNEQQKHPIANDDDPDDFGNNPIDDEEIDSDFELSDNEMEQKFKENTKTQKKHQSKPTNVTPDIFHENQARELKKLKQYEKEMRKQRIRQLKSANDEDEEIIKGLEKKLKMNRNRSENCVPKMFNDGLDYALELCLPDNIKKMYNAAKDAALINDSDVDGDDDDFLNDLNNAINQKTENNKASENDKEIKESKRKTSDIDRKMAKLRKIESKYFGDSDLDEQDSEFENDIDAEDIDNDSDMESASENSDDDDDDDSDDNDDDDDNDPDDDDDEKPLEVPINKKKSKHNELKNKLKTVKFDLPENSTTDLEDDDSYMSEDSEKQVKSKSKLNVKNQQRVNSDFDDATDSDNQSDANDGVKSDTWEDIYGRKRDKIGNIIQNTELTDAKYVPPHQRDNNKSTEKQGILRNQLKGLLNRLSEANMHKIINDIDNLFLKNSRFDMKNILTALIQEALISNVLTAERMILEYILLVTTLHANIGTEIGAHFLQAMIEKFNQMFQKIDEYDVENKQLDNVILIVCHLYTFKIFQHTLIYEILNKLITKLSEKSAECILLTLRAIGFSLRKDDPMALKDLIATLQLKYNELPADIKNNSRLKFMFDVLLAIKNNNVNKIPQYDPTVAEHLRKILKTLLINGKYVTTLNVTLNDLLNADKNGKWWIVGSAWTGNLSDIGGATKSLTGGTGDGKEKHQYSDQLVALAKKQRMNTIDKKNIFCIIMSAEDYIEAFEKLLQLGIKDNKIIMSVIMHCCLSEKVFNPYYVVLTQKFCDYDRKYQLAVQFLVWDKIKDLKSFSKIQASNLAKFLIELIKSNGLAISVLKVIAFGELDKMTMQLVRQIVLAILLDKKDVCKKVFERIAPSVKLKYFKDSIRLFMHHFLLKGGSKNGVAEEQLELLKNRIKIADKALDTIDSKIQF